MREVSATEQVSSFQVSHLHCGAQRTEHVGASAAAAAAAEQLAQAARGEKVARGVGTATTAAASRRQSFAQGERGVSLRSAVGVTRGCVVMLTFAQGEREGRPERRAPEGEHVNYSRYIGEHVYWNRSERHALHGGRDQQRHQPPPVCGGHRME